MKLIKQSYEIIPQENTLEGLYKHIEKCGRICYKSEDKITDNSAKTFVDRLIKSGHGAMLEHATVYLKFDSVVHGFCSGHGAGLKYMNNPYSKVNIIEGTTIQCVTTNYRVLVENNWLDDLQYLCNPTEHHHKRVTVKFVTDQGILREFTRHRVFSFAVESTRYCNYSKDKYNNEITFIIPSWSKLEEGQCSYDETTSFIRKCKNKMPLSDIAFLETCAFVESKYLMMTMFYENTAQEARNILPLATKCDMVMTGFVDDWKHFFDLRARGTTGAPHPQAKELAEPLLTEFIKRGILSL